MENVHWITWAPLVLELCCAMCGIELCGYVTPLHACTPSVRTSNEDTEGMTSVLLQLCHGIISRLALIA